jgi:hypothetical protein
VILGVSAKGETSIQGGEILALDERIADDPVVASLVTTRSKQRVSRRAPRPTAHRCFAPRAEEQPAGAAASGLKAPFPLSPLSVAPPG